MHKKDEAIKMEDENLIESSPMDLVWSVSRREGKRSPKRKYQEDSGYTTTPSFSQSSLGTSWGHETTDEGFVETPRGKNSFCIGCCSKEWEDWEKDTPLLPATPEAAITLPVDSPTQPKILRSRDLPCTNSSYSKPSSEFNFWRPTFQPCVDLLHSRTDFIHRFTVSSNFEDVLDLIFSYLPDSDITTMTMVSKTWYKAITQNKVTRGRWLNNVALRKSSKENLNALEKSTWERSPLKTRNHSTPLRMTPSSPPCSPSKFKFNLFRKEAEKLKEGECLMHCPACDLPSRCTPVENLGKCIRVNCALEFCTLCRSPYHKGTPCVLLSPPGNKTPQKRITKAQSRRNLRRLLQ